MWQFDGKNVLSQIVFWRYSLPFHRLSTILYDFFRTVAKYNILTTQFPKHNLLFEQFMVNVYVMIPSNSYSFTISPTCRSTIPFSNT